MLGAVVVGGALTLVLGLLDSGLLVTLVKVADDVGVELLDLLFKGREALDSIMAVLWRRNLKFVTYLEEFMRAEKGCDEIFSSMGRLTEAMGTLEMPLS